MNSPKLIVGSTNPVKINAVISAASETWPEVAVTGLEVASGISEQPLSDEETYQGARNRALAALKAGKQQMSEETADTSAEILGIGLEGGVFSREGELWSTVWCVVVDATGFETSANGARFKVPPIVAQKIVAGEEMGPIVSTLVGERDIRKKQGMIGVITQGFIDRTEEYTGIAKMALGLWYGREWDAILVSQTAT